MQTIVVQITLLGLKPGEDNYQETVSTFDSTIESLQHDIESFIYEFRNKHLYYKIKYTDLKIL